MANEIKDKHSASAALTITLASLASSTAGVGRQSDVVDNSSARYQDLLIFVNIKLGTSPTSNRGVYVYLIRDDSNGTVHRDDGAGASDAGLTIKNAAMIGAMTTGTAAGSGDVLKASFLIQRPGPKWAIAIVHDSGVNLDATGGNHWVRYIGLNPEVQ